MPGRKARGGQKKETNSKAAKTACFSGTKKSLACLQDFLRCVICGKLPDKIYMTSKCDHKYCKLCVTKVEGKICLICDVKVEKMDVTLDGFSTGLASRVINFEQVLEAMSDELKKQ